jgi:hypothetical protein
MATTCFQTRLSVGLALDFESSVTVGPRSRGIAHHSTAGQESGQEWDGKYVTLCYIWIQKCHIFRSFCRGNGFSKSGAPQGVVGSNPMPSALSTRSKSHANNDLRIVQAVGSFPTTSSGAYGQLRRWKNATY